MIDLVFGGASSGKSAFAESLATEIGEGNVVYLATMNSNGKEAQERIKKHRNLRHNKGFRTIECEKNISQIEVNLNETILLEDLGNLLANLMFSENKNNFVDYIISEIDKLSGKAKNIIIVSNDIFCDLPSKDKLTNEYVKNLGLLHQKIAKKADKVFEVVAGITKIIK